MFTTFSLIQKLNSINSRKNENILLISKKFLENLGLYGDFYFFTYFTNAITSISTSTSFGNLATSTHERAGLCLLKYSP